LKFLTSGKVKEVFDLEDDNLLFKFSDRVSAYDVKFNDEIPKKGEVLCKFAEFWFNKLGIPNHFIKRKSETEIIVKKLKMFPIECIVRGYFYGSFVSRWKNNSSIMPTINDTRLAAKLPEPIFDPTTKSTHDVPITREFAIEQGLVTEKQFDSLSDISIKIYNLMTDVVSSAGFILADLKLEFGFSEDGIILADSIGPDEYRLWPKDSYGVGKIQEAYDKQLLRDWLTAEGYQKQFEDARSQGKEPIAPGIPSYLITKISDRYVESYERIVGHSL